jgi:DNA excision repair protein ERCC-2
MCFRLSYERDFHSLRMHDAARSFSENNADSIKTVYTVFMKERTEKPEFHVSVRNLVEFLLRSGDIDSRLPSGADTDAMQLGAKLHRKIQKGMKPPYTAEVPLKRREEYEDLVIEVEGRADGIIDPGESDNGQGRIVTIDEIKGMLLDVRELTEPLPLHLSQAKCYAFIYAEVEELKEVRVRMTYASLETEELNHFDFAFSFEELEEWYLRLMAGYYRWAKWQLAHGRARDISMQNLPFPFPYREGQKALTAAVYHTILKEKELFLMAPTGVGKTMSCLYPAVRSIGEGLTEKIFYMTAKNETLRAGEEALCILQEKGLIFRTVRITAKEKICPMREVRCNPEDCPYAKGHFDRINDVLFDCLDETAAFTASSIRKKAEAGRVCPYELSLELTAFCDAILCDYNYVFDPASRLRRFFSEGAKGRYVFLVDEAHNLVERGREMFSASLVKEDVLSARRLVMKDHVKAGKALKRVNELLLAQKHLMEEASLRILKNEELEKLLYSALGAYEQLQLIFRKSADAALKEKLLDFYFELGSFIGILEELDEDYVVYTQTAEDNRFTLKLFCISPAARLTRCMEQGRSTILFSATLLPVSYYIHLLNTHENPLAVYAESPFLPENRLVLIADDVSTRYTRRGPAMYRRIAQYIHETAGARKGNYLAFFPSYKMLQDVFQVYRAEFDSEDINWVVQSPLMTEDDREIFLENFYEHPAASLIGFAVMGGIFSEGIDLKGTRLSGAVIVGTGLPQVSAERDLLKAYYEEKGLDGFSYAYTYPGMNKVEQAAGRVIRTMDDRGVVLLLDDRFLGSGMKKLFPREWKSPRTVRLPYLKAALSTFWETACRTDI